MKILLLLSLMLLLSCQTGKAEMAEEKHKLCYLYIYNNSAEAKLTDSLMLYLDLPFERSLELYEHSDTITKHVVQTVYFSTFELQKERFAVISDSAATTFYRQIPDGHFKKEYAIEMPLGWNVSLEKKDLNADGYNDALFTMVSGGSHGDDNLLLFYNPLTCSLIYHEQPEITNIEFCGNKVISNSGFLSTVYQIKGYDLLLQQQTEYLQDDNDGKKIVSSYSYGRLISTDTLQAGSKNR